MRKKKNIYFALLHIISSCKRLPCGCRYVEKTTVLLYPNPYIKNMTKAVQKKFRYADQEL